MASLRKPLPSFNLELVEFPPLEPGWRNWQTQRTQNPPVLSTLGVQLPLPAPALRPARDKDFSGMALLKSVLFGPRRDGFVTAQMGFELRLFCL